MLRWIEFKYPKIVLFLIVVLISYVIFSDEAVKGYFTGLSMSYALIFIAGMLFSFGFSSPIGVGMLLIVTPENVYIAALVGALGALIADLTIFSFIRAEFMHEFHLLEHEKFLIGLEKMFVNKWTLRFKKPILYVLSGLIIASPLPNEIGIAILAGLTKIKWPLLTLISFICSLLGVYILLVV